MNTAQLASLTTYLGRLVQDRALRVIGDSMALGQGTTVGVGDLASRVRAEGGWIVENAGVGGETTTQVKTRFLANRLNWTQLIWMGRNNPSPINVVLSDYAACIAALGHQRFLVTSILPNRTETTGTGPRSTIDSLNAQLAAAYPANFVNLIPVICTDPGDVVPVAFKSVPGSDGDPHLNDAGYAAIYPTFLAALLALPASPSDMVPDAFTFSSVVGQEPSVLVASASVQLSGINTASAVSVTGGEYQINGGAWTSASGTVVNGALVAVRVTTSASLLTGASATLTVGGISATFTATTANSGELVVNGGFDTDTSWTKGAGVTITGGEMVFAAASFSNGRQTISMVAGRTYRIRFALTSRTSGSVYPQIFGTTTVNGTARSVVNTYTQDLVAPAAPASLRFIGGTASDTLAIDNVSMLRLD